MPPKKDESALIGDLREYIEWVGKNIDRLQSRDGAGHAAGCGGVSDACPA